LTTSSTVSSPLAVSLERLQALLASELQLARELKAVMLAKQQTLVTNDVAALQPQSERELALSARFAAAEGARLAGLASLAGAYGLKPEAMRLELLLKRLAGEPHCAELGQLAVELKQELRELQLINDDNRHLTQNLLDYAALVVKLAARASGEVCYGRDGQFNEPPASRALVDDRI
jgi:flagellar biosynthesis/type III secretory pathway chaperone